MLSEKIPGVRFIASQDAETDLAREQASCEVGRRWRGCCNGATRKKEGVVTDVYAFALVVAM